MTPTSRMTKIAIAAMATFVGGMSLAETANARIIYYGETITFREAKRLCAGINGRVFLSSRDVYGCQGDPKQHKRVQLPPPGIQEEGPFLIKSTSSKSKKQNFTGRKVFGKEPAGGGGGEGGAGGGNGGGSGGGNF